MNIEKSSGYWALYQTDRNAENPEDFEKAVMLVREVGREVMSPSQTEEDARLRNLVSKLIQLGVDAKYLDKEAIDVMNADDLRKGFYWDIDWDSETVWLHLDKEIYHGRNTISKICDYEWRWNLVIPPIPSTVHTNVDPVKY